MSSLRSVLTTVLAGAVLPGAVLLGCTDDDAAREPADEEAAGGEAAQGEAPEERPARFCDVFLEYLAEPTDENLGAVTAATSDRDVLELAQIVSEDERTGRVIAADSDLQALARERCQAEWVGAAAGGGDTAGAAQAFLDALVAGDRIGARNVASANAIARFEPWAPIEPDAGAGTPALLSVGDRSFTVALDRERIAECQVEAGVVIACTVAS